MEARRVAFEQVAAGEPVDVKGHLGYQAQTAGGTTTKADYGSQEAQRQLHPSDPTDRLVSAVAALVTERQPSSVDMTPWCHENVLMHGDACGALFSEQRSGIESVLQACEQYSNTYNYTRRIIATAAKGLSAFVCFSDENVSVAQGSRGMVANPDASCNVMGIWCVRGSLDGRLAEVWPYRQLTAQERAMRFKDPQVPFADLDVKSLMEPSELESDESRSSSMYEAAAAFDAMYARGSTADASHLLDPELVSCDLLYGGTSRSRDEWVAKHDKLFQTEEYQRSTRGKRHTSSIAVCSHSNKAFVHWEFRSTKPRQHPEGVEEGVEDPLEKEVDEASNMGGMNMLVFNLDTGKISSIIGFRTPTPAEAERLLKNVPVDKTGVKFPAA